MEPEPNVAYVVEYIVRGVTLLVALTCVGLHLRAKHRLDVITQHLATVIAATHRDLEVTIQSAEERLEEKLTDVVSGEESPRPRLYLVDAN